MSASDVIQTVANIMTALGVLAGAYQLLLTKRLAQLQFEDALNAQYRSLLNDLPLDALLGKTMSDEELKNSLRGFYRYFDLSNEQSYLHDTGRVSKRAWKSWREGILQNMNRPAFRQAWQQILPDLDGSFDDLKALVKEAEPARVLSSPSNA